MIGANQHPPPEMGKRRKFPQKRPPRYRLVMRQHGRLVEQRFERSLRGARNTAVGMLKGQPDGDADLVYIGKAKAWNAIRWNLVGGQWKVAARKSQPSSNLLWGKGVRP